MRNSTPHKTGYTATSATFDSTAVENPFYETSAINGNLIYEMKNNILIVEEKIILSPLDN